MTTLRILNYNNYYNRIVKIENSLNDYMQYVLNSVEGINFNTNDGVNTEIVLPKNTTINAFGNYVIIEEDNMLISRWFILDATRISSGRYRVTLKRDLFADYYNDIVRAPAFIEKATLKPSNPLIFNSENMSFNQIKTSETLLKDETKSAWIVGYVPRNALKDSQTVNVRPIGKEVAQYVYETEEDFFKDYPKTFTQLNYDFDLVCPSKYRYITTNTTYENFVGYLGWKYIGDKKIEDNSSLELLDNLELITPGYTPFGTGSSELNNTNSKILWSKDKNFTETLQTLEFNNYKVLSDISNYWGFGISGQLDDVFNLIKKQNNYKTVEELQNLYNLKGKYVYINSTNKLYQINIGGISVGKNFQKVQNNSELFNFIKANTRTEIEGLKYPTSDTDNAEYTLVNIDIDSPEYYLGLDLETKSIYLENVNDQNIKVTFKKERIQCEDQPFDIFCLPYNSIDIYKNDTKICTTNGSVNMSTAISIGESLGSGVVYDIQLLPYCPARYLITPDGNVDVGSNTYDEIVGGTNNDVVGVILWATNSNFTLDIPYTIDINEPKISNECDMYRLVSPNFNGQFEFSPAKNGGVNSFNVDCTYQPYSPYIHINPKFKKLYGQDFNDARGLICGGDFSLPQVSNAWANYKLSNKNYQASFDRQIESMEINNYLANINAKGSAVSGVLSGIAFGSQFGPLGAVLGGSASAVAGVLDVKIQKLQQEEALDYKQDQFGYQLGNIKAMPNSLMKTSALTYNNKLFPMVEYYTCTEIEKQALRDKLKYNGMTTMTIGNIEQYMDDNQKNYIKGKFIRLEISDDYHLANELANEFNKGVFI